MAVLFKRKSPVTKPEAAEQQADLRPDRVTQSGQFGQNHQSPFEPEAATDSLINLAKRPHRISNPPFSSTDSSGPIEIQNMEDGDAEHVVCNETALRPVRRPAPLNSSVPLGPNLGEAAYLYASRGWSVLPLGVGSKTPLTANGVKDATTNPETVAEWWDDKRSANIGIATGRVSGIVVMDVDVKGGAPGLESLASMEEEHGTMETLRAISPSGGVHLYFRAPEGSLKNRVGLVPGIDIRGDGGYIVAPPSRVGGSSYRWVNQNSTIAEIPEWLVVEVRGNGSQRWQATTASAGTPSFANALSGTGQGGRNDLIFRMACRLRQEGIDYDHALALVRTAAGNCSPPLAEDEALRCLNNAWGYAAPVYQTDLGNSERFAARHGDKARFIIESKVWMVWNGTHWQTDAIEDLHRLVKETIRSIADEASNEADEEGQKALKNHSRRSESKSRIDAMLALAAREPGISIRKDQLDSDDYLLGVQNGLVNLRTGEHRSARPEDLITRFSHAAFDAEAQCPTWLALQHTAFAGNAEMMAYLRRMAGYCLTGAATERVFFIFYGDGGNGKTTFAEILRALLSGYAIQAEADTFMVGKGQRTVRNDIARLAEARLVTASETDEGKKLAEGLIKNLTGGDTITARFLFQEYTEFRSKFKLILLTNPLPEISGMEAAIWDRLHLVHFPVSIPMEERDLGLRDRLLSELPGILNWALAGCLEWQRVGLQPPEAVTRAKEVFRQDVDKVGMWLAERCDPAPGNRVQSSDLYADFRQWLEEQGEEWISQRHFGERLVAKGIVRGKSSTYFYEGLSLRLGPRRGALPSGSSRR